MHGKTPKLRPATTAIRSQHASAERATGSKFVLLAVLLVAQLMVILDITAVNIALPSLSRDLDISGSSISWTITSYSLIFGSLLLFGGRAADLLGRRRMFLTGLGIFTAVLVRLGHGRHRRRLVRGSGGPGSRRRDALPGGARDHHDRLPGQPAGQSARGLGRGRRCRRRDRCARRRRADRVQRLADDLLRQSPGRSRTRDRRTEDHPGRHVRSRAGGDSTSGVRHLPPPASARSSSRSLRPRVPVGLPPRLTCSASADWQGSLPSRPSSGAPIHRCSASSAWPTARSAAASS